jgi:hypothetical protein
MSDDSGTMPIRATSRAARIVVADPVSTNTSGIFISDPRYATWTLVKGRSSFSVSCIASPNSDPMALSNVQSLATGVHVVEFTQWVFPVKSLVTLQSRCTIRASLNHRNAIQQALMTHSMGLQSFNNQPLIRISLSHL